VETTYKITIPYIGGTLSVNRYKIVGRFGHQTNKTRKEVEVWMGELTRRIQELKIPIPQPPVGITLFGRFEDDRCPDLANLHKVIGDAIKVGLGLDDKYFNFTDKGYSTGFERPELDIEIITGG
jgi:hypothetical protein